MKSENPEIIKVKSTLHPRNKHRHGYDFKALINSHPALEKFVKPNKYGNESIDFFKPAAVKALNKALLIKHYNIKEWDIPDNYLCPPIPGRADYLHAVADLLAEDNHGRIPKGDAVEILDIGVGANCIYPIIGIHEYQWKFMGSETDDNAIKAAIENAASNPEIIQNLQIRKQENSKHIFINILKSDKQITLSICNPPFHESAEKAYKGTLRKLRNLTQRDSPKVKRNFGGKPQELWCEGGELVFVGTMIQESQQYAKQCKWFTSLISKESNLDKLYEQIQSVNAFEIKVLPLGTSNKKTRILAWTFQNSNERKLNHN